MMIPPGYLRLIEQPHRAAPARDRAGRPIHRLAGLLLPAATGAAAGALTAWLMLQGLG